MALEDEKQYPDDLVEQDVASLHDMSIEIEAMRKIINEMDFDLELDFETHDRHLMDAVDRLSQKYDLQHLVSQPTAHDKTPCIIHPFLEQRTAEDKAHCILSSLHDRYFKSIKRVYTLAPHRLTPDQQDRMRVYIKKREMEILGTTSIEFLNSSNIAPSVIESDTLRSKLVSALTNHSSKKHTDRDLPQICEVMDTREDIYEFSHLDYMGEMTYASPNQLEKLLSDFDSRNSSSRISVTDADVIRSLVLDSSNDDDINVLIEQNGLDCVLRERKEALLARSASIAFETMLTEKAEFGPSDPHYSLWKEWHRLKVRAIENGRDESIYGHLLCEDSERLTEADKDYAISQNEKTIALVEKRKAEDRKWYAEFCAKLLPAEKAARRQANAATKMRAVHRAPHRARRATAGHGAAAKAGDDGDGDGEPPRPRSFRTSTPSLHSSLLAHSLIFAGGAQ